MRADPIVAQTAVMHVVMVAVQVVVMHVVMHAVPVAVPVAVMHAVMHAVLVVALSVTAPCVRYVRLALIARRAHVRMIVHSAVNRLKAAKLFASYLRLVVVARAKF
jgi:hypothetical protein